MAPSINSFQNNQTEKKALNEGELIFHMFGFATSPTVLEVETTVAYNCSGVSQMFKQCSKCSVLIWINNNNNNELLTSTLLHPQQLFVNSSLNVYVCCKFYIKDCSAVLKFETDFASLLCVRLQYCLCLCLLRRSFGDDCIALEYNRTRWHYFLGAG